MAIRSRSVLDRELRQLHEDIRRLASMVEEALTRAMEALVQRDLALADAVRASDEQINLLRYKLENECLRILATQQPAAGDLRTVVAAIHVTIELERMGDHAAGIAGLVKRMEGEDEIDSLHQLPKMSKRACQMIEDSVQAYLKEDAAAAYELIQQDDKLDRQYAKLFRKTVNQMRDNEYIRRATFMLWAGHNLERVGDRATNIAERVIFMTTGRFIEIDSLQPEDDAEEE